MRRWDGGMIPRIKTPHYAKLYRICVRTLNLIWLMNRKKKCPAAKLSCSIWDYCDVWKGFARNSKSQPLTIRNMSLTCLPLVEKRIIPGARKFRVVGPIQNIPKTEPNRIWDGSKFRGRPPVEVIQITESYAEFRRTPSNFDRLSTHRTVVVSNPGA